METKSWKDIKDTVYGEKGTERRDILDRGLNLSRLGGLLRKAREEKNLNPKQLADLVKKNRLIFPEFKITVVI